MAFFCEIIPLTLLYTAIKYIGSLKSAIIGTLEIPTAALVSFFIMGEKLLPIQSAGILLVVFSVIMLRRE